MKSLHTKETSNGSNLGWLIRQMSINQKSGRKTFRRRFVSGSFFVSPCPPECYLQSETKIEPDLRLQKVKHHVQLGNQETSFGSVYMIQNYFTLFHRNSCLTFKLTTASVFWTGCNSIIKLQNQTRSQSRSEINTHTEHLVQKYDDLL